MKKIAQILAVIMMLTTVVVLTMIPANATVDFNRTVSDHGTGLRAIWSASLTVDGINGSAELKVEGKSTGAVAKIVTGSFEGWIKNNNQRSLLFGSDSSEDRSLTISDSTYLPNGRNATAAECTYTANGEIVRTLSL